MNWPVVISAILGVISTIVAATLGYLGKRGEQSATDRQYISKDMRDTIEHQEETIGRLQARVDQLEERWREERNKNLELDARVRELEWHNAEQARELARLKALKEQGGAT